MKLLIIGAGGVGTSAAKIIERRGAEGDWAEKVVVADYDFEERRKLPMRFAAAENSFRLRSMLWMQKALNR
ncbi:hypothetical protein NIA71_09555 [Ihubacter massiliensis]|uniref:hypothetical protein n=1 Tax=Ihubacter massiliensis TaxID=1852367 RepID=UPI0020969E2F|nr:hypothetical protein [Ihubacter massiliensis]MCO7122191.1 hypothetical protein [Ihubacter massiliensis]